VGTRGRWRKLPVPFLFYHGVTPGLTRGPVVVATDVYGGSRDLRLGWTPGQARSDSLRTCHVGESWISSRYKKARGDAPGFSVCDGSGRQFIFPCTFGGAFM
jgi:hypothetical protein